MATGLDSVMDQLATRLRSITGLRATGVPVEIPMPDVAIVSYPEAIAYDLTYQRGYDVMRIPVVVVVGRVSDRNSRNRLAGYCLGSGATSVKQCLESGVYTGFQVDVVSNVDFDALTIKGADHMAAIFDVQLSLTGV